MAASTSILLGIWKSNQIQRIKIDNVDLESKVEYFREEATKKLENKLNIEFSYCGVILENGKTLSSYGITPGVTIHVMQKIESKPPIQGKKLSEAEVARIVKMFQPHNMSYGYRAALQRLSRQEVLDKLLASAPSLADDPAALAIILDPELIVHIIDPQTIHKFAEQHPAIIEAASFIASHMLETQATIIQNGASTSSGYSYSLEILSDDDDMDSTSDTNAQQPLTRNSSYNAITAAQLAAAIANATNTTFNSNSAGMPSTPTSSNSIITNEMFTNAIQQAFAASPFGGGASTGNSTATSAARNEETLSEVRTRLLPQLQQMHEMGLVNDSVNIRALQATSGDVQAAIELVFNGVID